MTVISDNQSVIDILAERPPDDVPGVLLRLEAIQVLADQRHPRYAEDGLACFNYLYHKITAEVWRRLRDHRFRSTEFIARLDVEFAKRYFQALLADATGTEVPRAWQVLLARRSVSHIDPQQFAVAGVNAHVNFDLPFALLRTLAVLELSFGEDEHADYQAINEVFAEHMRSLRRHFENRLQRELDHGVIAQLTDGVDDLTVVLARNAAWHRAKHLATLVEESAEFNRVRAEMDWQTSMIGRAVLVLPVF
jgi:hypothetical protein